MALPTARSPAPDKPAFIDTKISGADVPKATIVRPMSRVGMPKFAAIAAAPLTKRSALQIRPIKPIKIAKYGV